MFTKGQKVYHKSTGKKVWRIALDSGGVKVVITDGTYEVEVLRENLRPVEESLEVDKEDR